MKRRLAILILLTSATPLGAQWLTLSTPGVPRTANGEPDLSAPAPRSADGHPDLSGLWLPSRVQSDLNDSSSLQAWVRLLADERRARFFADNPRYQCLPSGPENLTNRSNSFGLRRILQHRDMVAMLYNDGTYRQIFMDGRRLEANPFPTWMGYSVGHWDDDTLVVESNGYNDKTWLGNGISHTEALLVTERYRRPSFGQIQIAVTYEDAGALTSTQRASIEMQFVADEEMLETVCAEAYGGEHGAWTSETTKLTKRLQSSIERPLPGTWAHIEGCTWLTSSLSKLLWRRVSCSLKGVQGNQRD